MNFTLVAACRGRYAMLERFIRSAFATASRPEEVELFVMSDDDDSQTRDLTKHLQRANPTWNLRSHSQPRSLNLNRDYINAGVAMGTGRYTWALGNDVEIVTPGWDEIVLREAEAYFADKPDRIAFIYIDDDLHKPGDQGGCNFPILSRESVDAVGFHMPPEFTTWGADHWLWEMYTRLVEARVLSCRSVRILHHAHHTGRASRDEINCAVERNASGSMPPESLAAYVQRLDGAITRGKSAPLAQRDRCP